MIKIYFIAYAISLYLSLPGFLNKAGYSSLTGLIPFYNIYLLLQVLEISPILLIILSLCLIFLPMRVFFVTLIFVFFPFIIADAYNRKPMEGLACAIIPFLIFPVIAYFTGDYCYNMEDY